MILTLPRLSPAPGGKPVPTGDVVDAFRAFARDLAAGRLAWDENLARFLAARFDALAAVWDAEQVRDPAGGDAGRTTGPAEPV
ncbi:hypothetical protein, partial [Embleya sp. NPDC005575]|uniref:hypothetical protein n=1 Tax=Embleya sp. NPDC005575 TaxID=3156892 RepID=UPI0033AD9F0B